MRGKAPYKGRQLPGLRQARENAFLSQTDLAKKAGLTQSTIWSLEAGDTGRGAYPATIRKLAKALDVHPTALVKEPNTEKELVTH